MDIVSNSEFMSQLEKKNSQIGQWEYSTRSFKGKDQNSNQDWIITGIIDSHHKQIPVYSNRCPQESLRIFSLDLTDQTDALSNALSSTERLDMGSASLGTNAVQQCETDCVYQQMSKGHRKCRPLQVGKTTASALYHTKPSSQHSRCEHQHDACLAKENCPKKNFPQKATVVVTPSTQQVEVGHEFSSNKENHGCPETISTLISHHQQIVQNIKQPHSRANETVSVPHESSKDGGFCLNTKAGGPVEANKVSIPNDMMFSTSFSSVTGQRNESVKSLHMENHCMATFLHEDNVTVTNQSSEAEARMEVETSDKWSVIPVTKWTLQKLRKLVIDLEQRNTTKEISASDPFSEILKVYWKGDYHKLCEVAKSNLYTNIMKDVRLYCGTENSVIIQISNEKLHQVPGDFNILKHGAVLPNNLSSSFNSNEKILNKDEYSSLFISSCSTLNEVVNQVHKTMNNVQTEKIEHAASATSSGKMASLQAQCANDHEICNRSTVQDKLLMNPVKKLNEGSKSVRMTLKKEERELEFLSKMSPDATDEICTTEPNSAAVGNELRLIKQGLTTKDDLMNVKPRNLVTLETKIAPSLEEDQDVDVLDFGEIHVLSPENAERLFAMEKVKRAESTQIISAMSSSKDLCTQSRNGTLDQLYKDMHFDQKKPTKRKNRNHIKQVKSYCCLAKWFHILGYATAAQCVCEKNTGLGTRIDILGKGVKEGSNVKSIRGAKENSKGPSVKGLKESNVRSVKGAKEESKVTSLVKANESKVDYSKPYNPFPKVCEYGETGICMLRNKGQEKDGFRHTTPANKLVTSSSGDGGRRKIKTLKEYGQHDSTKDCQFRYGIQDTASDKADQFYGQHKGTTAPEFRDGGRIINLALYGTSRLRQQGDTTTSIYAKKRISGMRLSNEVSPPPANIQIRVGPYWNNCPSSNSSKNLKQHIYNTWRSSYVPSRKFTDGKKSKKHRNPKQKKANLGTFTPTIGQSYAKKKGSSKTCELTRTFIKRKDQSNHDLMLDFKVLPEHFQLADGSTRAEAEHSSRTDSGTAKHKATLRKHTWASSGAWHISSKRKKCLKFSLTSDVSGSSSTFQEFKKRYEEMNQRLADRNKAN